MLSGMSTHENLTFFKECSLTESASDFNFLSSAVLAYIKLGVMMGKAILRKKKKSDLQSVVYRLLHRQSKVLPTLSDSSISLSTPSMKSGNTRNSAEEKCTRKQISNRLCKSRFY